MATTGGGVWIACVIITLFTYSAANYTGIETFCLRFRKVVFDRLAFFPDNAIGLPYGTEFHVVKSHLETAEASIDHLGAARDDDTAETKDNRAIFDDQSAQKLSHEEICSMKESGMKGKVGISCIL